MSRRFASPMPAVKILVTGTFGCLFGFDHIDDALRIRYRALARVPEEIRIARHDTIQHDNPTLVADAAGVVWTFDAPRAGRLATGRDLIVGAQPPGVLGLLRLGRGRNVVRTGAHRVEHGIDFFGG